MSVVKTGYVSPLLINNISTKKAASDGWSCPYYIIICIGLPFSRTQERDRLATDSTSIGKFSYIHDTQISGGGGLCTPL